MLVLALGLVFLLLLLFWDLIYDVWGWVWFYFLIFIFYFSFIFYFIFLFFIQIPLLFLFDNYQNLEFFVCGCLPLRIACFDYPSVFVFLFIFIFVLPQYAHKLVFLLLIMLPFTQIMFPLHEVWFLLVLFFTFGFYYFFDFCFCFHNLIYFVIIVFNIYFFNIVCTIWNCYFINLRSCKLKLIAIFYYSVCCFVCLWYCKLGLLLCLLVLIWYVVLCYLTIDWFSFVCFLLLFVF